LSERLYFFMFRFLATQPTRRGGADRPHMEPWLSTLAAVLAGWLYTADKHGLH
jgi:hypothetical protein